MLVLADAGLIPFELFNSVAATGADLAWRVGASVSLGNVRRLTDGSYQALLQVRSNRPAPATTSPPRSPTSSRLSSTRSRIATPTVNG